MIPLINHDSRVQENSEVVIICPEIIMAYYDGKYCQCDKPEINHAGLYHHCGVWSSSATICPET